MLKGSLIIFTISVLSPNIISGISSSFLESLTKRSLDFSPVQARLNVWANSFSAMSDETLRFLLIGYGPQSTFRQDSSYMVDMKVGEGSFDSAYFGFLVDYGMALTLLIIAYLTVWMFGMFKYHNRSSFSLAGLFIMLGIIIIFSMIFQQFGANPAGLIALQILGFKSNRNTKNNEQTFI
jgi:hypothetical protein